MDFVTELAKKISEKSGRTFYVGGYVRDSILGIPNKDIDIEVHGIPVEDLKNILLEFGEIKLVGESFGVFRVGHYDVDISLPRTEVSIGDGHRDFEVDVDPFIGTKLASKRRDFTINALMKDVLTGEIIDEWNGLKDLENKVIRHIDSLTFIEDPLRVLRAAGFASRFDFKIATETIILSSAMNITELPKERVFEEISKVFLKSKQPSIFFETLIDMVQLSSWFEEVENLIYVPQSSEHHPEGNVWNHTMIALNNAASKLEEAENPLAFMFSVLCHDFGKIVSTEEVEGKIKSIGHDIEGVIITETFLDRITNEKALKKIVLNHVELHMRPNMMIKRSRKKSLMKLWDSSVCPNDLILLAYADKYNRYDDQDVITALQRRSLQEYEDLILQPQVMGADLVKLGLKPSPQFSEILEFTHKLHLAGVDKEDAIKHAIGSFKLRRKINADERD